MQFVWHSINCINTAKLAYIIFLNPTLYLTQVAFNPTVYLQDNHCQNNIQFLCSDIDYSYKLRASLAWINNPPFLHKMAMYNGLLYKNLPLGIHYGFYILADRFCSNIDLYTCSHFCLHKFENICHQCNHLHNHYLHHMVLLNFKHIYLLVTVLNRVCLFLSIYAKLRSKSHIFTWWNGTIVINTVFAIRTLSLMLTSNNTFFRSAFVVRSTICIFLTSLGHADFVPTLIFIHAVKIVFTTLETFALFAFTFFATLKIFIT